MSKQANPTVIGGFVLGAVVLLVVGVVVFGGGKFFTESKTYVLYFDENIKGLNIGAPVNFKGTRVGTITGIKVIVDQAKESIRIPVYMTLEDDRIQKVDSEPTLAFPEKGQFARALIEEQGLRAQLQSQSLVTGQLVVELAFHPESPINYHDFPDPHPEFPTIPSMTQELAATIEDLNLGELVDAAMGALKGIEQLANSQETKASLQNLNAAMKSIKNLAKNLDASFAGLKEHVNEVLKTGQATLEQAEKTLAMEEGASGRLAVKLEDTFDATRVAMDQAQRTLKEAQNVVGENSTLRYELGNTLEELSSAARSIRVMADYLERHPEALIHGKGRGGK